VRARPVALDETPEASPAMPEPSLVEQATREFLERDKKLAEESKRRLAALIKRSAPRPRRKR
jgi:hypothetical protein